MHMKHWTAASFTPEHGDPLSGRPRPGHFILDRWEVLQLVKDTSGQTGLGEREIAVLAAHLGVLTKGPVRADQLLVSYAQVAGMLDRANCMDERRFRRGEARLEELGFVTRHLSGNGRRYPVRDASGCVVEAYGIDLRPLFLRHAELVALRETAHAETCRLNALRSRVSAALTSTRRIMIAAHGETSDAFAKFAGEVRNLLRRSSADIEDLLQAEEKLAQFTGETPISPDRAADDAGQFDRHSKPQEKEIYSVAPVSEPTQFCEGNFEQQWHSYAEIAEFYPDPPHSEREFLRIIFEFSGFVGVREGTVRKLIGMYGATHLAQGLDLVAKKISEVGNPDGYLSAYVRRRSEVL